MLPKSEIVIGNEHLQYPLEVGSYPDGTPLIKHNKMVDRHLDTMILRPRSFQTFVAALMWVDAAADRGLKIKNLVLPFIPGSRQDRLNPEGDYLFTLKSVARMINARNFDTVMVVDPHSTVAPALIDRCHVFDMTDLWVRYWSGWSGIIAPDLGASKRSAEVARIMKKPFHQAEKKRDIATGKLTGFSAPTIIEGEHYLIVDDICDGGGTFLGLAEVIKEKKAFASLFVTHGIFSQGTDTLLKTFKTVATTDSTVFTHENVLTVAVVEDMVRSL